MTISYVSFQCNKVRYMIVHCSGSAPTLLIVSSAHPLMVLAPLQRLLHTGSHTRVSGWTTSVLGLYKTTWRCHSFTWN